MPQHAQVRGAIRDDPARAASSSASRQAISPHCARRNRRCCRHWAWTDPGHDFARIPIERAMALYARQHAAGGQTAARPQRTERIPAAVKPRHVAALRPDAHARRRSAGYGGHHVACTRGPADTTSASTRNSVRRCHWIWSFATRGVQRCACAMLLDDRARRSWYPGYYGCANLCDAVRAGVAQAVRKAAACVRASSSTSCWSASIRAKHRRRRRPPSIT